jgi:hypothetical protein
MTAVAAIAGIEAVQMIRKGQVLGITKKNLHGQGLGSSDFCSVSSSALIAVRPPAMSTYAGSRPNMAAFQPANSAKVVGLTPDRGCTACSRDNDGISSGTGQFRR